MKTDAIKAYIQDLIAEGQSLITRKFKAGPNYFQHGQDSYVPLEEFAKWSASCRHLAFMLGNSADPWRQVLNGDGPNRVESAMAMAGCLESIREAIDRGLLTRAEQLIAAELFDDLLEQAEHLLSKGYSRAAAVLGRAVLEEHLHKACGTNSCLPAKSRASIHDYARELYGVQCIDKLQLKTIEAMAAIGNAAAHYTEANDLPKEQAEHLLLDLRRFMQST